MMLKLQQPPDYSSENYSTSRKCTTPELFKLCNANGKVKYSTEL